MANEYRLQDPGEGIHEAEIVDLEVSSGDEVEEGDILFSIETDKATVEVPSPFTGKIEDLRISEGDTVEVGAVLLTWTGAGDGEGEPAESGDGEEPAEEEETEDEEPAGEDAASGAEEEEEAPVPARDEDEGSPEEGRRPGRPVPAAPATRRLARELGVDLREVRGSGPAGRVTPEDVRAAAEKPETREDRPREEAPERAPEEARPEAAELPDFERWGEVERVPLRSVRKTTARRMALSWERIPHVTHFDEADVTELDALRREEAGTVEEAGGKLTITAFVVKAAVAALREHPRFNASLDSDQDEIVLKRYFHVGVAVDTERGLVVPVIRDVDRKSLLRIAVELTEISGRAREGKLERKEMQGGSFTVTNPGPIGGIAFTPIINHPEVAILGIGRSALKPVLRGDDAQARPEPRRILPLSLAFDHRVNDGADAARFTNAVIRALASPRSFLLHA